MGIGDFETLKIDDDDDDDDDDDTLFMCQFKPVTFGSNSPLHI